MSETLDALRSQADGAAVLGQQRDQLVIVIETWTEDLRPVLGAEAMVRWKKAVLLAFASLYTLDLSREDDRAELLGFVQAMQRIAAACSAMLPAAQATAPTPGPARRSPS